jgi:hypothetical protein
MYLYVYICMYISDSWIYSWTGAFGKEILETRNIEGAWFTICKKVLKLVFALDHLLIPQSVLKNNGSQSWECTWIIWSAVNNTDFWVPPHVSDSVGLGWGPRIYSSNKSPSDADNMIQEYSLRTTTSSLGLNEPQM